MTTIVCDTNVLVSATFWKGASHRILRQIHDGQIQLAISEQILDEYSEIIQRAEIIGKTGPDYAESISKTRQLLVQHAIWVQPSVRLSVVADDPDDDRVLEAAVEAKAHAIVTQNRHLLKLENFRTIRILTPEDFERQSQD